MKQYQTVPDLAGIALAIPANSSSSTKINSGRQVLDLANRRIGGVLVAPSPGELFQEFSGLTQGDLVLPTQAALLLQPQSHHGIELEERSAVSIGGLLALHQLLLNEVWKPLLPHTLSVVASKPLPGSEYRAVLHLSDGDAYFGASHAEEELDPIAWPNRLFQPTMTCWLV
jgi:hypothetical protein